MWQFWALVFVQEVNSIMNNTGLYMELTVYLFAKLSCPVSNDEVEIMEERRAVFAPCDNCAEIVAPLIILITLASEALFHTSGLQSAPLLSETGILASWRMGEERLIRVDETAAMLTILFAIRCAFCYIEVRVRIYQRGSTLTAKHARHGDGTPGVHQGQRGRQHRLSVVQFFHGISSMQQGRPMRFYLGALLFLQPLLLVVLAAATGKTLRPDK